jgi:hypothetical protein
LRTGYNAAPIVVAWVDIDEQIPARWDAGSKVPIVPVGGLRITNASVVDNRTRPFLATGSPRFANGSEYLEFVPQVIGDVRFSGSVANPQRAVGPPLCAADLGGKHSYQARSIKVDVDCRSVGDIST